MQGKGADANGPHHACASPRGRREKGAPKTERMKTIARGASFFGSLLLMYAIATGLTLNSSGGSYEASAIQQHAIVGIVGSVLCFAGLVLLLRMKP